MTYGDSVSDVRAAMIDLLKVHRVRGALGGGHGGLVPETTTEAQKRVMGTQIQSYRAVVLAWCTTAVEAMAPKFTSRDPSTKRQSGPVEALRFRLGESAGAVSVGYPSMEQLVHPQENALVDKWRLAARACVLSEVDMGHVIDHSRLDAAQALVVLKDAGDFTHGLVVLDQRYRGVPGWQPLANAGRLETAARSAAVFAAGFDLDHSVDAKGMRAHPAVIEGPARPGLAGVIQAQHNLVVALGGVPPTGMNMRRIFGTQTGLSHELARHAEVVAPELVETLRRREETYRLLGKESRNFGGLIGNGGPAAAESANAYDRVRRRAASTSEERPALRELTHLCEGTDARIASTIERGFAERIYFVATAAPSLGPSGRTERWVPVTSTTHTNLPAMVRDRLRPPAPVAVPQPPTSDRLAYQLVLSMQPGVRDVAASRRWVRP